MNAIDNVVRRLTEAEHLGAPVLTVSLDLTPGPEGIPPARQILKQMWRTVEERFPIAHDDLRSYQADQEIVESLWEPAIQAGARGLFYAGCSAAGFRVELETHYPLRHSAYLAERPWPFELARYRYLLQRPMTVALVDLSGIHAMRIYHGHIEEELDVEHYANAASGPHERHDTQGRGAGGGDVSGGAPGTNQSAGAAAADTSGGWHSKTRIEKSILAHRRLFAKDEAEQLAQLVEQGDLLLIAGPDDARSDLMHALPEPLHSRVILAPAVDPTLDESKIADRAMEYAVERQYEDAEAVLARWRSGDLGEQAIAGVEAARRELESARVGTLVLHEDIVTHFGTGRDARERPGRVDSHAVGDLLRGATASSVELLFTRDAGLLEEHEGVAGILRW